MAKGQMRSNKEVRKPRKEKGPAAPAPAFGKQIKDLAEQGKKGDSKS